MRVLVAEERNGQHLGEHAFESATITVGRDPGECQIVFDSETWPMVSRKHAEFRVEGRRCMLIDTGSSFGTFLDGGRILEPTEVRAGSRVQFGPEGPTLCVVQLEPSPEKRIATDAILMDSDEKTVDHPANKRLSATAPMADVEDLPPAPRLQKKAVTTSSAITENEAACLDLVNDATGDHRLFQITKDVTRIGRELNMDVRMDAEAAVVSRHHADIERRGSQYSLIDQNSFNGTLLNGQRITAPTLLGDGDHIQLGMGGPVLLFHDPSNPATNRDPSLGQFGSGAEAYPVAIPAIPGPTVHAAKAGPIHTTSGSGPLDQQLLAVGQHGVLLQRAFEGNTAVTIGRAYDNDIRLDGLQISNHHALVVNVNGNIFIEDAGSTNGVYINGSRITSKVSLRSTDTVQIGPFLLLTDPKRGIAVLDTRSKTRVDAIDITKIVPNRAGGGTVKLLDDVQLTVQPNEFVGLLGPSGAGKSTLMDSLNGMRPATSGQVLINNQDLYQHLDSLKQSIGYVPQDDIIHRELTVYRTLYYVARLRLARDVSTQEIDQIVNEVMDVTGLSERRNVAVGQLSGGQRKRVSIAVELITKPSIIFLDEPTSGLDPATEEKIMKLFRQIAESGHTVILTTHAMENVKLFDKIVVLMRGKLVFYGAPQEALAHVRAENFKDLYDKLEAPIEVRSAKLRSPATAASTEQKREYKLQKERIAEDVAEEWKQSFLQTEQYKRNIQQPLGGLKSKVQSAVPGKPRSTVTDALRQWQTLAHRYLEVLRYDKFNLLILFGQAPVVAFLTYLVVDKDGPRDFPYFVLALVAFWFGTSIAAREIIRERAVYNRERMVNLRLLPYVGSKILVLSLIVGLQCILLFGSLRFFHLTGMMNVPGDYNGVLQLLVMILTSMVGIALGLFVSALVKTSEMATSVVPLLLIPQILFCGLVGVPKSRSKYVGAIMPATWAFDELKRLSSELGVLRGKDEEAMPSSKDEGRGFYKEIKHKNDQLIDQKQKEVEDYKSQSEDKFQEFDKEMNKYQKDMETWNRTGRQGQEPRKPTKPALAPVPPKVKVVPVPDNLSGYVDFLHPWGDKWLDPLVLLIMFLGLTAATVVTLRLQDIG